jgi:hypothetical protein
MHRDLAQDGQNVTGVISRNNGRLGQIRVERNCRYPRHCRNAHSVKSQENGLRKTDYAWHKVNPTFCTIIASLKCGNKGVQARRCTPAE